MGLEYSKSTIINTGIAKIMKAHTYTKYHNSHLPRTLICADLYQDRELFCGFAILVTVYKSHYFVIVPVLN